MRFILFLMVTISIITPLPASAYEGIFTVLDTNYIQIVEELPVSEKLIPDKAWDPRDYSDRCRRDKNPAFIWGWIDIVGFRNQIKMNNQYFINEPAMDAAIVQYETHPCTLGIRGIELPMINKVETYMEGNNLVAKLTAIQILFSIDLTGHVSYYYITKVLYDSEPMPVELHNQNEEIQVIVRERNFTIINSTDISIEINDMMYDRYRITTGAGYYEKTNRLWRVENTSKGVNYANETRVDLFKSDNISHSYNTVGVTDLNFTVTASGFFNSTDKVNITRIYEHSDPMAQFLGADLLGFLGVLSCFYVFFVYVKRQVVS